MVDHRTAKRQKHSKFKRLSLTVLAQQMLRKNRIPKITANQLIRAKNKFINRVPIVLFLLCAAQTHPITDHRSSSHLLYTFTHQPFPEMGVKCLPRSVDYDVKVHQQQHYDNNNLQHTHNNNIATFATTTSSIVPAANYRDNDLLGVSLSIA